MAYRVRGRGQFTASTTRSGKSFNYSGRNVKIAGDNFQLNWNGPEMIQEVLEALSQALSALSVEALERMRQIVPVDTGDLRESCFVDIDITGTRLQLIIGAGMPYAIYVELGTFKTPAQPFLRPTFDFILQVLPFILNSEVAKRASRS